VTIGEIAMLLLIGALLVFAGWLWGRYGG